MQRTRILLQTTIPALLGFCDNFVKLIASKLKVKDTDTDTVIPAMANPWHQGGSRKYLSSKWMEMDVSTTKIHLDTSIFNDKYFRKEGVHHKVRPRSVISCIFTRPLPGRWLTGISRLSIMSSNNTRETCRQACGDAGARVAATNDQW